MSLMANCSPCIPLVYMYSLKKLYYMRNNIFIHLPCNVYSVCWFSTTSASSEKRKPFHSMLTSLSLLTLPIPFSKHVEIILSLYQDFRPTYSETYAAGSLQGKEHKETNSSFVLWYNIKQEFLIQARHMEIFTSAVISFPSSKSEFWEYILSVHKQHILFMCYLKRQLCLEVQLSKKWG